MAAFASARALDAVAARLSPRLRRGWDAALARLRRAAQLDPVLAAIAAGDTGRVADLVFGAALGDAARRELYAAVAAAVQSAAAVAAATGPRVALDQSGVRVRLGLDPADPRAIAAVQSVTDALAAPVLAEWRAGVVRAVEAGLTAGDGPRAIARRIARELGLTEYDRAIVDSFARALADGRWRDALRRTIRDRRFDPTLRRLARQDAAAGALTAPRRAAMVAAYRRKLDTWRRETWARTVALNAARSGEAALWASYADRGLATEYVRVWITAQDERVRPAHRAMHGRAVGLREPWHVPGVGPQRYPGETEYNCRCTVLYVRRDLSARDYRRLVTGAGRVVSRPVPAPRTVRDALTAAPAAP